MRHVGHDQAVAEANQVLFFNAFEGYRISHPVPGGDASLTLVIGEGMLRELAPTAFLRQGANLLFRPPRLRIDARTQALVALLRHSLRQKIAEPLQAETLSLTLVQRSLGSRTSHVAGATLGRQRLVDRVKLVLASDLARRWTLAEIAAVVRGSPVYLTQVFQQVEGLPLYRYQLRLRLARALDLLAQYDDLTDLSQELGFFQSQPFSKAPHSATLMAGLRPNSDNRHCTAEALCCEPGHGKVVPGMRENPLGGKAGQKHVKGTPQIADRALRSKNIFSINYRASRPVAMASQLNPGLQQYSYRHRQLSVRVQHSLKLPSTNWIARCRRSRLDRGTNSICVAFHHAGGLREICTRRGYVSDVLDNLPLRKHRNWPSNVVVLKLHRILLSVLTGVGITLGEPRMN